MSDQQHESRVYGYANVGYFGLAHSLLAWARCRLWTMDQGVPMLAPSWWHIRGRIGPRLRRERDTRQYQKLFAFPGYVTGLRRLYLLGTASRLTADAAPVVPSATGHGQAKCLVVEFENQVAFNSEAHFPSIVGRQADVHRALLEITRPRYRPASLVQPHIAVHVRLGDFAAHAVTESLRSGGRNARLPMDWYASMLSGVRARLACENLPAVIYSDGSDEALSAVLSLPHTSRAPRQSAVTDLLSMAQAGLLISSGSGFSQWGSYLGSVPRICFPGQRFIRVHGDPIEVDLEPECEGASELPSDFLEYLGNRLGIACSKGIRA